MKLNKLIFLILIGISIGLGACHKEQAPFTDMPIIEGYIQPGNVALITIKRQVPFSSEADTSSDNINKLTVNLKVDGVNHVLTPIGSGQYVDSSLNIVAGTSLYLSFRYNNMDVSASTTIPAKPQNFKESESVLYLAQLGTGSVPETYTLPDPVTLTWTNTDKSYYIVLVVNTETTLVPIRNFGSVTPPGNRFRKSPSNSNQEEIHPMEFEYFGMHRIILYHVLPDYASLYNVNSTSSQTLSNPSTTITNGYGIFTGMNMDTLWVNVKEQ